MNAENKKITVVDTVLVVIALLSLIGVVASLIIAVWVGFDSSSKIFLTCLILLVFSVYSLRRIDEIREIKAQKNERESLSKRIAEKLRELEKEKNQK